MKKLNFIKLCSILLLAAVSGLTNAGAMDDVRKLQKGWAEATYNLSGDAQEKAFEKLVTQADNITHQYPSSAETWIWNGIIKSSFAGVKGGLEALGLVKDSRAALQKAISINPDAMQGSAYTSLGTLYFKVPGWPIAFGDDEQAELLLKKALTINPDGIDSNYFYAEFLMEDGKYADAKKYLQKAQQAAPRASRPLADKGRQQQIRELLASIDEKLLSSATNDMGF